MNNSSNALLDNYYEQSKADLSKLDKYQLVNIFNRETSHSGWGGVHGSFLWALRECLVEAGLDISEVADKHTFSLKYPVFIDNDNKLVQIKEVRKN